jgi:hypothetical protein
MKNDENAASSKSINVEAVELTPGANYKISGCGIGNIAFTFTAEEGGTFAGEANGSIQAGKLMMKAGEEEYEGTFVTNTVANATWKNAEGVTGSSQLTL